MSVQERQLARVFAHWTLFFQLEVSLNLGCPLVHLVVATDMSTLKIMLMVTCECLCLYVSPFHIPHLLPLLYVTRRVFKSIQPEA